MSSNRLVLVAEVQLSEAITRDVRVTVEARYHPERSVPGQQFWFFSYTVHISNIGKEPVQLLSRHWIITDATGKVEEVKGPGVIGYTPHLNPGESFKYTSACPLPTSMGSMEGSYQMITDSGEQYDARISAFSLCDPMSMN